MSEKKARGDRGEEMTAQYLVRRGYAVLARQWHCRYGELDLVARSPEGILCFVEVKLRRRGSMELPREAVSRRKQEKLRMAAACYLAETDADAPARFDVAEIYLEKDDALRVEYLEDAFI